MLNLILFDDPKLKSQLLPFTYTVPVAELRCGILSIAEKWQYSLPGNVSYQTEDYLQEKYPQSLSDDNLFINGSVIPDDSLISAIRSLQLNEALLAGDGQVLALRSAKSWTPEEGPESYKEVAYAKEFRQITQFWHINRLTGPEISADLERIKPHRKFISVPDPHTICYDPGNIFIEEGAKIKAAILNAETGPIYIGKNAQIQEGSTIQGPFAIGEGSILAQGSKIRPNCSIGHYCKVGGEVNQSVFFSYSNKGHDGYLGSSIIGNWCNLGANTNNSNLKNDYKSVKLFSHATAALEDTGLPQCGLYMGDYSKSGINTMFNTGTVVGVHVNVFGAGFQEKFVPSFTWGGKAEGYATYRLDKALAVAELTAKSKNHIFTETDRRILEEIYRRTEVYR